MNLCIGYVGQGDAPQVKPALFVRSARCARIADGLRRRLSGLSSLISCVRRASAAESALTIPDAFRGRGSYADLKMPVAIIAGAEDRLINPDAQSARLHADIPQSSFVRVAGAGHMVHQTATAAVMAAIDEAAPSAGPVRDIQAA